MAGPQLAESSETMSLRLRERQLVPQLPLPRFEGSKMQRESARGPRGSRPVHSIEGGRRSARRVKLHIEACLSRAFMLVRAKSYRHATPFYPGACPRATAPPIASGGAGWAGAESWAAAGAPALSLRAPSVASSGLSGGVSIAPASPGAHTLMCFHNGQNTAARSQIYLSLRRPRSPDSPY